MDQIICTIFLSIYKRFLYFLQINIQKKVTKIGAHIWRPIQWASIVKRKKSGFPLQVSRCYTGLEIK